MSYTIDVYRGTVRAQRNIVDFGAYVTMFPQLVAGPIVQYKDVVARLERRTVTPEHFLYGVRRFLFGLSKKLLLANNIGLLWQQISGGNLEQLCAGEAWLGALAFSFQIYFDFSGYSDMEIGLGAIFGFRFRENFRFPYCAQSITEFWRRWHISLGVWFREYVYIPLGGNRKGVPRQICNILIVWCLTGFWHSASWNFVVWGLYFGILLILEKLFLLKLLAKLPGWVSHLYCIFFIVVGWVIFAFDDLSKAGTYLGAMFGCNYTGLFNSNSLYYLSTYALLFLVCGVLSTRALHTVGTRLLSRGKVGTVLQLSAFSVLFFVNVCFLVSGTYNPFLYFRF